MARRAVSPPTPGQPAVIGARAPKPLPQGVHIAPFRGAHGGAVLLFLFRGGRLCQLAEVTAVAGSCALEMGSHARSFHAAEPSTFVPEDRLLPRGVHRAPWTEGAVRAELALLLDVVESSARDADAARAPGDPVEGVPPGYQFRRWQHGYPRGVYAQRSAWGGVRLSAVPSNGPLVVEIEVSCRIASEVSALSAALWAMLDRLDPVTPASASASGEDDPPDAGEEWKRGALR